MHKSFKSISDIIQKDKAFGKIRKVTQEQEVVEEFFDIFPDLEKIIQKVKVDNQVLSLRVENSVWRSELKFKQRLIINKINKHFGQELITKVKFFWVL